jgi:hypothetical protein
VCGHLCLAAAGAIQSWEVTTSSPSRYARSTASHPIGPDGHATSMSCEPCPSARKQARRSTKECQFISGSINRCISLYCREQWVELDDAAQSEGCIRVSRCHAETRMPSPKTGDRRCTPQLSCQSGMSRGLRCVWPADSLTNLFYLCEKYRFALREAQQYESHS